MGERGSRSWAQGFGRYGQGCHFPAQSPSQRACARLSGVKNLCFLCYRQRKGPSSRLVGEWSQWGSLGLGGGFSRAMKGGPQTLNPPTFLNGVALAGGGRWALQGALIWGLVWAPSKEAVPVSGRRTRPGLLAVCPGDPTLRNPMFFVLSCCLSPVCLPPMFLSLQPQLLTQHPISVLPAPQPSGTPKGAALKALPCSVPVPSCPTAEAPVRPAHPDVGAPPPPPPPAPSFLQLLSSGSGPSFTLSSFPVPRPGLQRAAGGKAPGLCSLCLKSPGW